MLPDPFQPIAVWEPPSGRTLLRISHLNANAILTLHEPNSYARALAVLAGIRQGFLADAVDGVFQGWIEAVKFDLTEILYAGALLAALFVNQMGDRLHHARFVENWRADAGNEASGLEMGLPQHHHAGLVGLDCILGALVVELLEDLELHDCPGQLLGQAVVDVVGDELPLVVARLQQMLEVEVLFRQGLLGLLALRDVAEEGQ